MEIQKIFSEIDTDEKLYSVLMTEEELAFYSEIQKEFGKVKQANKALKKAWEAQQGKDALLKHAEKYHWNEQGVSKALEDKGRVVARGRESTKTLVPERKGSIKEAYKNSDINEKINVRGQLVSSRNTKLRIQHDSRDVIPGRPGVEFKQLGNSRKNIIKSKINDREKKSLLHSYDHGKVEANGQLSSGRDMGYNNYEHNVFRAGSGTGYNQTW